METSGQITDGAEAVVFDTSSGISLEEQREILAGINAMSAGNALAPEAGQLRAKKRGFLFPLLVNLAAVILLGAGFLLLSRFHVQDEQNIRAGSAELGLTERKMIQEIRQETNRRISEKEDEINGIRGKLSEADAEYRQLQVSVENLTEEQKERAAALLLIQEEYRGTLSSLEAEKSRIIEDSRKQEAELRARAEERAQALSSQIEQSRAELSAATEELARLSGDQERAARAESQMASYYAAVNERLDGGRLDEVSAALQTMREFLDAPSLRGIRSFEARKQTHLESIAALEKAADEARRFREEAAASGGTAQAEAIAALEKEIEAQKGMITILQSGADSQVQELIAEHEAALQSLGQQIEGHNARYEAALKTESELRGEIEGANNTISERDTALAEQRAANEALRADYDRLQSQYTDLNQRMEAAVRAFTGEN